MFVLMLCIIVLAADEQRYVNSWTKSKHIVIQ